MSDSGRLFGFGLLLAAALGAGFGLGVVVGPIGAGPSDSISPDTMPAGDTMPGSHS